MLDDMHNSQKATIYLPVQITLHDVGRKCHHGVEIMASHFPTDHARKLRASERPEESARGCL